MKLNKVDEKTAYENLLIKYAETWLKLTKAKKLLNACICKARGNVNPSWSELISDIEQFIKEIEK